MATLPRDKATAPEGQRDRAKRDRQQRIADAAASLLLDYSFDEITTKAVANAANIGEATLFRYISSKRELLTIVYGDQLDAVLTRIEHDEARAVTAAQSQEPSAAQYIDRILHVYELRCRFYLLNPTNAALYLREGFQSGSTESARHLAQGDRTIRLVAQILNEGQNIGVLANSVEANIVAQNCHGTYMHEIDRSPVRGYDPSTIWNRLEPRLRVQLEPLAVTP